MFIHSYKNIRIFPLYVWLAAAVLMTIYLTVFAATAYASSCPPPAGTAKGGDANGDGIADWLIDEEVDASGNKVQVWCLDRPPEGRGGEDTFGYRYVPADGSPPLWIGLCPYGSGINRYSKSIDSGTGNWDMLDWKNWDNTKDGSDDDEGEKGVIDDWKWYYDPSIKELITQYTWDGKVHKEKRGSAPRDIDDLVVMVTTLSAQQRFVMSLGEGAFGMVVDPVMGLVNMQKGPQWKYALKTPPGYPESGIDQNLMTTKITAGATLRIAGYNILNVSIEGRAATDEFGAWRADGVIDGYAIYTATRDAVIASDRVIDGFAFGSSGRVGKVKWMTKGQDIDFVEIIDGPVQKPVSLSFGILVSLLAAFAVIFFLLRKFRR